MKRVLTALALGASLLLAACGGSSVGVTNPSTGAPAPSVPTPPAAQLTGAGATFPKPFYDAANFAYNKKFSQVTINYGGGGSGAGISQLTKKTVDYGASDVPLSAKEAAAMGGADKVVQIASTLGTISLAYNLDSVADGQLKLTPDTIAGIFLGKITKWNDAALKADNGSVNLPNQDIRVIHRSDGSGTSYIFTDYLCSVNAEWKAKTGGPGKSITWPTGDGAQGNAGVATRITQTPGAIGYVELAYVLQTKMKQAALKNRDGNFVIPSAAGATAAAKEFISSPSQFSIVNAPGKDSAPISGYSWIILYVDQANKTKGTALVDYLYWLTTAEGQGYAVNLHYAALPTSMASYDLLVLKSVTSGGSALLSVS
jgi:phosphate transport system substrate-binding protein